MLLAACMDRQADVPGACCTGTAAIMPCLQQLHVPCIQMLLQPGCTVAIMPCLHQLHVPCIHVLLQPGCTVAIMLWLHQLHMPCIQMLLKPGCMAWQATLLEQRVMRLLPSSPPSTSLHLRLGRQEPCDCCVASGEVCASAS